MQEIVWISCSDNGESADELQIENEEKIFEEHEKCGNEEPPPVEVTSETEIKVSPVESLNESEKILQFIKAHEPPEISNNIKVSYELNQSLYDLIVLSPPWNGPGYLAHDEYDLRTMLSSGDGYCLACLAAAVSHFFVMVLPRNTPNEAITQICNIIHFQVIIENVYC